LSHPDYTQGHNMSQLTLADARTIIAAAEKTADDILAARRRSRPRGSRVGCYEAGRIRRDRVRLSAHHDSTGYRIF
jgi:hypothetical protein